MKANLDHTMLFVTSDNSNRHYIHGFGNGGLKKMQGEGSTFTAVPLVFNDCVVGSFNILSSSTKTGALSKQAIKKMNDIGLRPDLQLVFDERRTKVLSALW